MTPSPQIQICGQIDFSKVAFELKQNASNFDQILSIWDKDLNYESYTKNTFPDSQITFLYFNDDHTDPTLDDVQNVIQWARGVDPNGNFLIHCHAGLSRSPAAALAVLCVILNDVAKAVESLTKIRPHALPNQHLVSMIDQELDLNGELITAEQKTFYDVLEKRFS